MNTHRAGARSLRLIVSFFVLLVGVLAQGGVLSAELFHQASNSAEVRPIQANVRSQLGDPFFNLVLKDHSDVTDLSEIERLIQPDASKRHLFVVDESIASPARPQVRRAVIAFSGTASNGQVLDSNLMISVIFNSEAFPEAPTPGDPLRNLSFMEVWGWDNHRGRYNYYRLDRFGGPLWKFRGSSIDADLRAPADHHGTCFACHINGAPIMKELLRPWNNWHSLDGPINYLRSDSSPAERWPVANHNRFKEMTGPIPLPLKGGLNGAENLEGLIMAAITQFNTRRINSALKRNDTEGDIERRDGMEEMREARRLLRHVFSTTEFNIISDRHKSHLHPIPERNNQGPAQGIPIPDSFFLNANIIRGGGFSGFKGLGLAAAQDFGQSVGAVVTPDEYKTLVMNSGVRISGEVGDADFAWLVPEPSHIDNDMIDQLIQRGIVSAHFVAAALAIDLKSPVFSSTREQLFVFVPDRFRLKPPASTDDAFVLEHHREHPLTQIVIENLEQTSPSPDSPQGEFLRFLKADSPLAELERKIVAYRQELSAALNGSPDQRNAQLEELYRQTIERRKAVLSDPVLHCLDETRGQLLFPLPPGEIPPSPGDC